MATVAQLQSEVASLTSQVSSLRNELAAWQRQIEIAESNAATYRSEIASLEAYLSGHLQ